MKTMARPHWLLAVWRVWDRFWTRPVPPHALALVRIALGLFLFVYALTYLGHLDLLFARGGIALPLYAESVPVWFKPLLLPQPAWVVYVLTFVLLLGIAGLTAGCRLRTSIVAILVPALVFWQLQMHLFPTSYNRLLLFTLLVLLLGGADRAFSVRMHRKYGSFLAWEPASVLPQRLLAVQISATYLGVGWQKLWLPKWQGGEIMAYSFISRWATPPAFWLVQLNLPMRFWDGFTFLTKFFEFVLPFGLWFPRIQWWFFAMGAVFQILIAALLSIWWFVVLIPMYILFVPPENVQEWLAERGWTDEHGSTGKRQNGNFRITGTIPRKQRKQRK